MKKNFLKFFPILSLMVLFPVVTFAANGPCDTLNGLGKVICQIQVLLGAALPVLISLGVIYFVWGVVQYVIYDSEEAKTKGKDRIIYGLIGLAVIVSMWGLVNLITSTFSIGGTMPSLAPLTGKAATCSLDVPHPTVADLLCYVTRIINNFVIPLIFALAVVMFVWGTINFFIINADEEAKRAQGKQFMIWGIIALTVMISVWGLVSILGATFGINGSILPQVKPPGSSAGVGGSGGDPCADYTGIPYRNECETLKFALNPVRRYN